MTKLQSPSLAPSLANSPLDGLVDLACRDGVDVRPTLLRVLTDLYVQKPTHSDFETIQYVELALGLIDAVDAPTRAAVTASLTAYPAAPAAVLDRLASAVAATHQTRPEVRAEARPEAQAEAQAKVHAESRVETPKGEEVEADDNTDNLADLFFTANSEDRRLILLNLDAAATEPVTPAPPASADTIKRLENAALQRNTGEFSRVLERALNLHRDVAERVTRDASGEPIVVAAKGLAMKAAVLQRILLFINPAVGQSIQRVYELADLYDELSRDAAERMLAIWRQGNVPARPAHQSVTSEPVNRNARELATPTPRRANTKPEQRPDRFKSTR